MNPIEGKVAYCGIDVSKSTFDAFILQNSYEFKNVLCGFKRLKKVLPEHAHCVMEATGPYYLKLAVYLQSHGIKVSVVNPLVIKRFAQMKMIKAKTDKADAKLIALYAEKETPELWKAPEPLLIEIQQDQAVLAGLSKQLRMLNNQVESIQVQPCQSKEAIRTVSTVTKLVEREIHSLEKSVLKKVEHIYAKELGLITSIPGIGIKNAIALLVATNAFSKFQSAKQVASYIGICPRIYQSGSSIKGKGSITKMGDKRVRTLLYLAARSAARHNPACKQQYERLIRNGKADKLAIIAVANKLLKQAFAIVINKKMYEPEYYLALKPIKT